MKISLTIRQIEALVTLLGEEVLVLMSDRSSPSGPTSPLSTLTIEEILKFLKKIGGEQAIQDVLSGGKEFTLLSPGTILVDQRGRVKKMSQSRWSAVPQQDLGIIQPGRFNFVHILRGVYESFFLLQEPSPDLYNTSTERFAQLRHLVETSPAVAGLFNGPHFPVVLPQHRVEEYGTSLEELFLPALENVINRFSAGEVVLQASWKAAFKGNVTVAEGTRHLQLLERMKNGPVFGWYFPQAFWGGGLEDQREAIQEFPAGFLLSGAVDTIAAAIAHPYTFCVRSSRFPVLDCGAVSMANTGLSYGLGPKSASPITAQFWKRPGNDGYPNFSGGLLYIGPLN